MVDPMSDLQTQNIHLCRDPECGQQYKSSGSLQRHLDEGRGHGNRPSFHCPTCSSTFKRKASLAQHIYLHTGKPFKCTDCDKAFMSNFQLQTHTRVHTGVGLVYCSICASKFTQSNILLRLTCNSTKKDFHLNVTLARKGRGNSKRSSSCRITSSKTTRGLSNAHTVQRDLVGSHV